MLAFFLTLIPGVLTPVLNFFTAMKNTQVQIFQARTGAAEAVAVAAVQGQSAVQTKWWFAALPPAIIGFTIAMYVFKTIGWDIVIGSMFGCHGVTAPGTCGAFITDPLRGDLHWALITVITGYFSVVVAQQWFNSK